MEEKTCKKSYYLPETLMQVFADWCKPGRDFSPKVAGLILAGMAIDDSNLLDNLTKLAYGGDLSFNKQKKKVTGKAVTDAKQLILDALVNAEIQKELDALGPAKEELLRLLKQAKANTSRDS
jgi:hypothetical protein